MRGGDLEPPAAGAALFRVVRARARRDALLADSPCSCALALASLDRARSQRQDLRETQGGGIRRREVHARRARPACVGPRPRRACFARLLARPACVPTRLAPV